MSKDVCVPLRVVTESCKCCRTPRTQLPGSDGGWHRDCRSNACGWVGEPSSSNKTAQTVKNCFHATFPCFFFSFSLHPFSSQHPTASPPSDFPQPTLLCARFSPRVLQFQSLPFERPHSFGILSDSLQTSSFDTQPIYLTYLLSAEPVTWLHYT